MNTDSSISMNGNNDTSDDTNATSTINVPSIYSINQYYNITTPLYLNTYIVGIHYSEYYKEYYNNKNNNILLLPHNIYLKYECNNLKDSYAIGIYIIYYYNRDIDRNIETNVENNNNII